MLFSLTTTRYDIIRGNNFGNIFKVPFALFRILDMNLVESVVHALSGAWGTGQVGGIAGVGGRSSGRVGGALRLHLLKRNMLVKWNMLDMLLRQAIIGQKNGRHGRNGGNAGRCLHPKNGRLAGSCLHPVCTTNVTKRKSTFVQYQHLVCLTKTTSQAYMCTTDAVADFLAR
jgi:hypothetical protein